MKSSLLTLITCIAFGTIGAESPTEDVVHTPFTAKVTRNKVRLRPQPNLDCHVIRELSRGDLLAVIDEKDDFYVCRPDELQDEAYVYKNYISDEIIQGERVNVRLRPDLDSPVITQLNNGDKVISAGPSALDERWIQICVPEGVNYYVAKELVESCGDINYVTEVREKTRHAEQMISSAWMVCEAELQKPFEEISIDQPLAHLRQVTNTLAELPEQSEKAEELLSRATQAYTEKRLAYLEAKISRSDQKKESKSFFKKEKKALTQTDPITELESSIADYRVQLNALEETIEQNVVTEETSIRPLFPSNLDPTWMPVEEKLFAKWSQEHPGALQEEFYTEQKRDATTMEGVITSYNRPVKNKPGDFIVVDESSQIPIAFVYSTLVDLSSHVGKQVTITALPRNNNNFAFPAYFALSVE